MRETQPVVIRPCQPPTSSNPLGTQEDFTRLYILRLYAWALAEGSPYAQLALSSIAITLSNIFAKPPEGVRFPATHPPVPSRAEMEMHIDRELIWLSAFLPKELLYTLANHFNTCIRS
jgi:hypothetical protein